MLQMKLPFKRVLEGFSVSLGVVSVAEAVCPHGMPPPISHCMDEMFSIEVQPVSDDTRSRNIPPPFSPSNFPSIMFCNIFGMMNFVPKM